MAVAHVRTFDIPRDRIQGFLDDLEKQDIRWIPTRPLDDSSCSGTIAAQGMGKSKCWLEFWPASPGTSMRRFKVTGDFTLGPERPVGLAVLARIEETALRHAAVLPDLGF
jgi:hypothetical protein